MNNKTKLVICLGSSCYSRGNQTNLEIIKQYLKQHNLKDKVDFRGQLCSGNCSHGPVMRLDGKKYEEIDAVKVTKILDEFFFPQKIG